MASRNGFIFLIFLLAVTVIFSGCLQEKESINSVSESNNVAELKSDGLECNSDNECASGVCDFTKQDFGTCALSECVPGARSQGLSDAASFYCNENREWKKIKAIGESCDQDYECFRRTCKDAPACHLEDYSYSCKENVCVEEKQPDSCELQGLKRITGKDEFGIGENGECFQFMRQSTEITVCASCGNGLCEQELESKCNCPEDCLQ